MASRLLRRWSQRVPPTAADAFLVVVLLVLAAYEYTHSGDDGHQAGPFWLNGPLTVAELVPLVWRRRAPVLTFVIGYMVVIVPSLFVAHTLFAYTGSFPLAFYLYTVARHCDARTARWALLGPPIANLAYTLHVPQERTLSNLIFALIVFAVVWLIGRLLRRQALQRSALADALAQLGREQQQRQHLAVLGERARLARDLHDVVAHAVALMLVQAGAARLAVDDDVALARQGLLAVERTGREATSDLRRLLGLLRTDDDAHSLQPAPGLSDLQILTEQMSLVGLQITVEVIGEVPRLSPSLNLSAFRVIQEALTNVLKHAGPTRVRIRLDYTGPLRIEVVDDGPREPISAAGRGGHGLIGMQERVALFGGRLEAAPETGGFAVRVELPLQSVPG